MKKIIILLTFILHAIISLQAQTVSYEKLDSISSEISKMQSEVNGKIYNNGGSEFELSFPEENFKVFYNNQIATNAIYKKQNGKELLYLTENIDFSKATGYVFGFNNNILGMRVYFPAAYLKTQLYENGVLVNTISEESLEFFMINKKVDKTIFDYLLDLITSLQIAKGLTTEAEISNQKKDYSPTLSISDAQKFILKYPSSIYNLRLKNRIKQLEEAEKKGEEVFMKFEYFKYYKRGILLKDAKKEFPDYFNKSVCVKVYDGSGYLIKQCDSENSEINVYLFFDAKTNISMGAFGIIFEQAENDGLWSHGTKEFNTLIQDFNSKFGFAPTISDVSNEKTKQKKLAIWKKNGKTVSLELVHVPASNDPRSVIWLLIDER